MALLDDEQDPRVAAPVTPPPAPDPTAGMDPDTAQKFKTMKAFLGILPQAPATPPPRMPSTMDPAIAKAAQDRLGTLAGIQGLVGLRTVTPYDVKQGIRPSVQSSPGYEAAVKATNLPVEQEQARVAASGHNADIYNKYLEAQAGRESKGSIADVAALAKYLGTEASTTNTQTRAGATIGAAQIGANAKIENTKLQMGGGGSALTPEARKQNAIRFLKTGQLPSLGMGAAGAAGRRQIINDAAALDSGADLASNQASYGANKAALESSQKLADTTDAQEITASKNLDQFLDSAKHVTDTGSPLLNKPARWLDQNMGDPEVAKFNAARQVAATEVARVLQGGSQLTDSARHEIGDFAPADATGSQLAAVAQIIKRDMANRHAAQQQQLGTIKGRIGGQPQTQAPTWVKNQVNAKTGAKRGVYSDGSYGPAQ